MRLNELFETEEEFADRVGPLRTVSGKTPAYLYRIIHNDELDQALKQGYLAPSEFYQRIHASHTPNKTYGAGPDYVTIQITYRDEDNWRSKTSADGNIYATTYNRIPMSIVEVIS